MDECAAYSVHESETYRVAFPVNPDLLKLAIYEDITRSPTWLLVVLVNLSERSNFENNVAFQNLHI